MEVYIAINKVEKIAGVFVDKQGVAEFLGIHRNTVHRRLIGGYWEDDDCIIHDKMGITKSKRGKK